VADAVTSREGYTKAPKTDVQCKNRIDTLKKKYKVEKSKPASNWPFFNRLDLLLGPTQTASKALSNPNPNSGTQSHIKLLGIPQFPQRQRTGHHIGAKRPQSPPSVSSNEESSDGFPPEPLVNGKKKKINGDDEDRKRMDGVRAVSNAIVKFGQVYERMETSRLQQEMEMEKHRIEFARELELQRMQFFMQMQAELSQLEQPVGMRHGRSRDAGTSNFNYLNEDSDGNSSD
jgi:Myb/SANT-like DNA-binding domain